MPNGKQIAIIYVVPELVNSKMVQTDLPEVYNLGIKALKEEMGSWINDVPTKTNPEVETTIQTTTNETTAIEVTTKAIQKIGTVAQGTAEAAKIVENAISNP